MAVKRWLTLALIPVVAACGKEVVRVHNAPDPALPASWISLKSADSSVSIGIPSTFHNALDRPAAPQLSMEQPQQAPPPDEGGGGGTDSQPSPSEAEANEALERFATDLNSMSKQFEDVQHEEVVRQMEEKGFLIWAWLNGRANISENLTQISVKRIPNVGSISLDQAVSGALTGGADIQKVMLPIGEARVAKWSYQNRIGDSQTEIKYVLLDNGDQYVVRFAATNAKEQIEPIAEPVMQTLRIRPKA